MKPFTEGNVLDREFRFTTLKKSWAPNNKIVSNCGTLQFLPLWPLAALTVGAGRQSYFISRLCSSVL